ncbi:ATP-binding protein [Glaesserella parasuis]|uniref:ATP-binding protein n=1 Tax=Glaesserella parasuis TaxID=738 RepID=UPI00271A90B0|nr:ATP-binding protein [Glaesserella parasuis]MDO9771278.1 ATP-binding protein [Glaesserella parasuis]MDO9773416.1 ATP-binding protein [Glaesserella parasuis]MDO9803151.1 ATP-binding protein [Glaesserella parasuis]MDO9807215.1 ATP-binding protein [Glaesserella parasuis]
MIYPKEIIELYEQLCLQESESQRIEAKRCSDTVSDSVMQTVCAFANEVGLEYGYLLLGVSEPDDEHKNYWVSGVSDSDRVLDQIQTNCRNQFKVVVNIDAGMAIIENKTVIAVKVFELDPASKPCSFLSSGKNKKNFTKTGIWRRGLNGDYEATVDELQSIYSQKQGLSYENTFLPNVTWDDIDPEKIEEYRRLRRKVRQDSPELDYDDVTLLDTFNLIRQKDGAIQPNIAGLLLFGTNVALRKHLPMIRVDYIRHRGSQWIDDDEQRFLYTKDFRESLLTLIPRLEAMILDDIPEYFNLEENALQRTDRPFLPQKVVREAVVNMVMHRDYAVNQPSQVNRFSNRLELQNAGYSLKPLEDLGNAKSITRNPLIAAVLYDLKFAETKGSGVNTMRSLLKKAKLSPPIFHSNQDNNQFKATLLLQHLMREEQLEWLKLFSEYNLSDNEAVALVLARETGFVDNSGLREISGLDTLAASKLLGKLRDKHLLDKFGKGQYTFYLLSDLASNIDDKPTKLDDKPTKLDDKPTKLDDKPTKLDDKPTKLDELLEDLGNRSSFGQISIVIAMLCLEQPCSAEFIAEKLNRNQQYVSKNYLKKLIDSWYLTYIYPEQPNYPEQAYRTTDKGREWLTEKGIINDKQ